MGIGLLQVKMAIPEPVGEQQEVVCLDASGHRILLGTAGSGKTTMAVARAKHLVNPRLPSHGRVLIITFNKTLLRYTRSIAGQLSRQIDVENYHHFAEDTLHPETRCLTTLSLAGQLTLR